MNNYFCVLPFFGAEYNLENLETPCCLLPKNTDINVLRTEMLSGTRPDACTKCWKIEDKGEISDRQLKNSAFDFYSDTAIEVIESNCKNGDFSPSIIKLYTSNLCNSSCVTCGPNVSTSWQSLKNIPINKKSISDEILELINWHKVKMLSFVGGEPLYEKKNLDILEKLSSINPECFINIVTNSSVTLTDRQANMFKKFKNFNICLSIDGIGKQFEYIRYPLKWDTLLQNIQQYREIGADLSVSFTISNLNILYYNEITEWFKKQELKHNHILVEYPSYFNIDVLPINVKQNIPLVESPDKFDPILFERFIQEIKEQDRLKGINIKDYLPELFEIIENYKKLQ